MKKRGPYSEGRREDDITLWVERHLPFLGYIKICLKLCCTFEISYEKLFSNRVVGVEELPQTQGSEGAIVMRARAGNCFFRIDWAPSEGSLF
jgi:hypothetical protein